jgi:phosphoglucosamine mutase
MGKRNSAADAEVVERRKLFGTDGVRGVANLEPVTAETALKLGRAAAHVFTEAGHRTRRTDRRPVIIIGKDTRLSGYMLENAMAAGIMSLGVDVFLLGPLPTPGVAYITRSLRADAGIVLSASHNPYEDNGIKFFRHDGYKLDDEIEQRIENLVFSGEIENIRPTAGKIGKAKRIDDALGRYVEHAKASIPKGLTLEGMTIAVDAANGAVDPPRARRHLPRLSRSARRHEHQRRVRQHALVRDLPPREGDGRQHRHQPRRRRGPPATLR